MPLVNVMKYCRDSAMLRMSSIVLRKTKLSLGQRKRISRLHWNGELCGTEGLGGVHVRLRVDCSDLDDKRRQLREEVARLKKDLQRRQIASTVSIIQQLSVEGMGYHCTGSDEEAPR